MEKVLSFDELIKENAIFDLKIAAKIDEIERRLEKLEHNKDFKLCYVEGNFAYFTTQSLEDQWGDDWNDSPYQDNAGHPYKFRKDGKPWYIYKIAFDNGNFEPASNFGSFSVEQINSGCISWLRNHENKIYIKAGDTIKEFIKKIEAGGGEIYLPKNYKED